MYKREIEKELKKLAHSYPVVTVTGPRQSGKTTLVKNSFPNKPYVNLELPDVRELALIDPRGFFMQFPHGAVLDEIQRAPTLLSYIQVIVDEKEEKGMFILTGSHQFELHQAISQSLAGRTALLNLLPLSIKELNNAEIDLSLDEYLLYGGYPRIFKDNLNPTTASRNYFQTYIERDLRQLIQIKDLMVFQKFVRLCAGRIGQLINMEGLGNETGVSSHTVKHWISILEASFIVFRLQPYYENFGKRIVKTSKLYFTDTGLASYLLGIEDINQISRDPLRGNLIENLMILEMIKERFNHGKDSQLYFFRDAYGHEVDLIFQRGHELIPIEIKASQTIHRDFFKNLNFFTDLLGKRAPKGYLIYTGDKNQSFKEFEVLNYKQAFKATI